MGATSTRKGKDFEQEVARRVREKLGGDPRRGYQRRDGEDESDVVGLNGWSAECKYGDRARPSIQLEAGWEQAQRPGAKPVLFFRAQRQQLRVMLLADDFLDLLRELDALREQVRCG